MLAKLQNMSEVWQKRLFVFMTATAIAPLYFENLAKIGGVLFLLSLVLLSIVSWRKKNIFLNTLEKGWVWVSVVYALVFVLSFLLRPPYTYDGIWRLSSPGFILLLLVWFWVAIKLKFGILVIKSVAFTSIFFAVLLLVSEIYILGGWDAGYRYGAVLADVGKTAFFLPLTSFLLGALLLKERKLIYLSLLVTGVLLAALTEERKALTLIVFPILAVFILIITGKVNLSKRVKYLTATGVIILLMSVVLISKDRIGEIYHDYLHATTNNNFYTSMGLRVAMLGVGGEVVKKHFLIGVGPNLYKKEVAKAVDETNYSEEVKHGIIGFTHLHNQYIMDLVLSGFLGFIALIGFIAYPLIVIRGYLKRRLYMQFFWTLGFTLGLWVTLLFVAVFTWTYTTILYMLVIGAWIIFSETEYNQLKG